MSELEAGPQRPARPMPGPPGGAPAGGVRSFIWLIVLLFAVWLILTSSFHWQELIVGAALSLIMAIALNRVYQQLGMPPLTPWRLLNMIAFATILAIEIIKANLDVAWRVIHPKLPIRPGIVVIRTELQQDIAKLILANSITLTPGTFTLDIIGDELLIHWIDVRAEDIETATKLIGGRFEKYLRRIFK
ncbi:Na+/H+ antiporter subunit E [Candidatus Fermentibacterales bacterium]|nr:Na+/H+ antiporter subunit E [Candidatus Fermentibacterales bacterium]